MQDLFKTFDTVSKQAWRNKIEQDLKGAQYDESVVWESELGFKIQPFYHQEEIDDKKVENFTFNRSKSCALAQYFVWEGNAEELNKTILSALKYGVSSLILDFSNQSIDVAGWNGMFDQVQTELLDITFVNIQDESQFAKLLREVKFAANSGCLNFNSSVLDTEQTKCYQDDFRARLIDVTTIGNDSASLIVELALALSKGVSILDKIEKATDEILQFNFIVAGNYFFEIAKLRAFRFLWKIISKEYKLKDDKCYIQSELAQCNKSNTDENLNTLRATTEAMSAIIGGCDAILLNKAGKDVRDFNSMRINNNVFNILKYEGRLMEKDDPAAGSYYVESLTEQIIKAVWNQFLMIQEEGGFDPFCETEKYKAMIAKGKERSSDRMHDLEQVRNLYQN